jgi:hypothetical protein
MNEIHENSIIESPLAAWFLWMGLNALASGLVVGALRLSLEIPALDQERTFAWLLLALFPLIAGIAQTSLLASYIDRFGWWLPATIVGWGLGVFAILAMNRGLTLRDLYPYQTLFSFTILGLAVGLAQRLALRGSWISGDGWLAANIAGGVSLGLLIRPRFSNIWHLVLIGVIPSLFTGVVLAMGLYSRRQGGPKRRSAGEPTIDT